MSYAADRGCRWITAGDDYLELALLGHNIYCGLPVIRGGAWCRAHRSRVYLATGSPEHAAEIETRRTMAQLYPWQALAYRRLRRQGRAHDEALAAVLLDRAA